MGFPASIQETEEEIAWPAVTSKKIILIEAEGFVPVVDPAGNLAIEEEALQRSVEATIYSSVDVHCL